MIMERVLGLDIGNRYIGIAVSDPLGLTAQPYRTYKRRSREEDLDFFKEVVTQFNVKKLVCGLPLNDDGTESKQSRLNQNYANFLKNALDLDEVIFIDERYTTQEADEILSIGEVKGRKKRKEKIDTLAAQIILQEYMDNQNG